MSGFAWVTLATNDSYCLGALVLAHSLKRVGTKHDIAVLITPGVTAVMREKLANVFNLVQEVNVLDSQDEANLALLARPELGITFTKLHCWRLTQYEKCVFVDADTLVIRNCDELFEREELSAAPDVGWPDCFNSGVFVFKPSQETFASLTAFAASKGSFDGGDQGLLNLYFEDWAHKDISKHLPFIYNMCSTASYSYLPAYKQFGGDVRIIHFIGNSKPWLQYFDTQTSQVHPTSELNHLQQYIQYWWDIFCENVHPQLSSAMATSILVLQHRFFHTESALNSAPSPPCTIHHVCHTSTDKTYDEVDSVPDFSEFKDPWDDYVDPTNYNDYDWVDNSRVNFDNHDNNSTNSGFTDNFNQNIVNLSYPQNFSENKNEPSEKDGNFSTEPKNLETIVYDLSKLVNEMFERQQSTISNPDKGNSSSQLIDGYFEDQNGEQIANCENFSTGNHSHFNKTDSNVNFEVHKTDQNHQNDDIQCRGTDHFCDVQNSLTRQVEHIDGRQYETINCKVIIESNLDCVENEIKCNVMLPDNQSCSQSCTESPNAQIIARVESEMIGSSEVDCNSAGIASALASLTLGAARTPEQQAYEEHLRKQDWEQGQIDYMGRDSFDNIWKKICTTLSTTPETEPRGKSPPKSEEKEVSAGMQSMDPTDKESVAKADQQDVTMESHKKPTSEITEKQLPTLSSLTETKDKKSEPILALPSPPAQLCIKEFGEKCTTSAEAPAQVCHKPIEKKEEVEKDKAQSVCVIPLGFTSTSDPPAQETSASDSPVPIQVAESVLEADIKESVTEDVRPVGEEVISSISAPVQETISAIVETPLEPAPALLTQSLDNLPSQPNGSALDFDAKFDESIGVRRSSIPLETTTTSALAAPSSRSISSTQQTSALQQKVEDDEVKAQAVPEAASSTPGVQLQFDTVPTREVPEQVPLQSPKVTEESSKAVDKKLPPTADKPPASKAEAASSVDQCSLPPKPVEKTEKSPEPKVPVKSTEKDKTSLPTDNKLTASEEVSDAVKCCLLSKTAESPKPDETKPKSPETDEAFQKDPMKPMRTTKELQIPGTPIVTEATPPTSPPLEAAPSLPTDAPKPAKKTVKKVTKKGSEDKTEGSETEEGKKMVKKVVKKVVKKPKEPSEDGESSATGETKPKKVVKVVKKSAKTGQNLEADTTVPDTPPPAAAVDVPVPPKRKVKAATAKTTKKTETDT